MDVNLREDAGEQVRQAAQKLGSRAKQMSSAAWDKTKSGYAAVQSKTISGAKATDRVVRDYPYQSIGIAFGVGLLLGFLIKKK